MIMDDFGRLEAIGSSVIPTRHDLPLRLSPVLRERDGNRHFVLTAERNESGHLLESLHPFDPEEDWLPFAQPLPAQRGHILLQLQDKAAPVYVPSTEVASLLAEAARQALQGAADALMQGDRAAAEEYAWYASRAVPGSLLPFVLAIALARPLVSAEARALMDEDLDTRISEQSDPSPRSTLEAALRALSPGAQDQLRAALQADPRGQGLLLPSYLSTHRPGPRDFLQNVRRRVGDPLPRHGGSRTTQPQAA